jgi:hypothetical protein
VQLGEAAGVACERPALAGRAPPRLLGLDLEIDHGVGDERLAHALGAKRAAAERDDRHVLARE